MNTKKNTLAQCDLLLFDSMKDNYISVNEKNFFANMKYKQEYEVTALNDLIVSEYENSDEIYLVRENYEEYIIGHGIDTDGEFEEHVMTLSEALALNLKSVGFLDREINLLEWLRETDYKYVNYNRNYDLLSHGKR